jgi:hypothetical protein
MKQTGKEKLLGKRTETDLQCSSEVENVNANLAIQIFFKKI